MTTEQETALLATVERLTLANRALTARVDALEKCSAIPKAKALISVRKAEIQKYKNERLEEWNKSLEGRCARLEQHLDEQAQEHLQRLEEIL